MDNHDDAPTREDLARIAPILKEFYEVLSEKLSAFSNDINTDPDLRRISQKIRDNGVHPSMLFEFGIAYKKVEAVPRTYKERVKDGHVVQGTLTRKDRKLLKEMKISFDDKSRPQQ